MSRIYLIRHGQTDWNLAHRIQGQRDIPLNENGREQARRLAQGMRSRPVQRVFTSPLLRARETAWILAESQKLPLYQVKGLEEISYGDWEGMTMVEIQERYPEEYKTWLKDPVQTGPPGGESQMDVLVRTARAIESVKENMISDGIEAAAVVSHGASIVCMLAWLLKEDAPKDEAGSVDNASITTICFEAETGKCRLEQLNDIRHLEEDMGM